jgi:hypothetical protein
MTDLLWAMYGTRLLRKGMSSTPCSSTLAPKKRLGKEMRLVCRQTFPLLRSSSSHIGTAIIQVRLLLPMVSVHVSVAENAQTGGMLKAIQMILEEKKAKCSQDSRLVVDVHPSRPDYRGFVVADKIISLEADPTFADIEEAGAMVEKNDGLHTVLDDMFLISGEIPRVTAYEQGLRGAVRFDSSEGEWFSDEKIADERFLMCRLKGEQEIRDAHIQRLCSTVEQYQRILMGGVRQGNCVVYRLQPCRRGQHYETCKRSAWRLCPTACNCWGLSFGL